MRKRPTKQRAGEVHAFLGQLGMQPRAIVPIAARSGDGIVKPGPLTAWWKGPTLLEALGTLERTEVRQDGPLRFVVQDVYRRDNKRLIAGRVESGTLGAGRVSHVLAAADRCPRRRRASVAAGSRTGCRRIVGRGRTRCARICRSRCGREPRDRCAAARPCCADHGRLARGRIRCGPGKRCAFVWAPARFR